MQGTPLATPGMPDMRAAPSDADEPEVLGMGAPVAGAPITVVPYEARFIPTCDIPAAALEP
jgi:hypothetical protein